MSSPKTAGDHCPSAVLAITMLITVGISQIPQHSLLETIQIFQHLNTCADCQSRARSSRCSNRETISASRVWRKARIGRDVQAWVPVCPAFIPQFLMLFPMPILAAFLSGHLNHRSDANHSHWNSTMILAATSKLVPQQWNRVSTMKPFCTSKFIFKSKPLTDDTSRRRPLNRARSTTSYEWPWASAKKPAGLDPPDANTRLLVRLAEKGRHEEHEDQLHRRGSYSKVCYDRHRPIGAFTYI